MKGYITFCFGSNGRKKYSNIPLLYGNIFEILSLVTNMPFIRILVYKRKYLLPKQIILLLIYSA